jgi:hypothetical protein
MTICVAFGAICFTYFIGQTHGRSDDDNQIAANAPNEIAVLQQRRIELLQQRVTQFEESRLFGIELDDREQLGEARLDLLNAKLEYAGSVAEKDEILTAILQEYDSLIESAESALEAPRTGVADGPELLEASSHLLLLKSERVRIEIELASLN